jgi:hypothetical protein
MEIYENFKNILLESYNNTNNLLGGVKGDIVSKINDKIEDIGKLKTVVHVDKLADNLRLYKENLQLLLDKCNEKILEARRIKAIFDKNGNLKEEIEKLFDESRPDSLGAHLKKYKSFLKKYKFQREFLTDADGNEIFNSTAPDKDVVMVDIEEQTEEGINPFIEFNKNLLKICYPFISQIETLFKTKTVAEQKEFIRKNFDEEIRKILELTDISKQYQLILESKKELFNKIIDTDYKAEDIAFIDLNISEDDFKSDLKEKDIPPENVINVDNVNLINRMIQDVSNQLKIKESIDTLKDFKINLDDVKDDFDFVNLLPNTAWQYVQQTGGVIEITDKYAFDMILDKKIIDFIKYLEKLFETIYFTINLSQELKELQLRYNYYIAYVFAIIKHEATNSARSIYKYVNKEILNKYHGLIKKIKEKFNDDLQNPIVQYFNKYHYYTLNKLDEFMSFVITHYIDGKIIDVEACNRDISTSFIIFNHFKDILDRDEINF